MAAIAGSSDAGKTWLSAIDGKGVLALILAI
jgi:hypothetical protein